jgi:hypothetical protein
MHSQNDLKTVIKSALLIPFTIGALATTFLKMYIVYNFLNTKKK